MPEPSAANRYKRQAEDARRAIDARIAPRATPPAPVKSAAKCSRCGLTNCSCVGGHGGPLRPTPSAATDRELKAWVWSFLICYAAGLLGAFGWGRHWNAYVCLLLALGSVVLWATFVTAWKNRLGR